MAGQTKIEWADATFNPWMGCTRVSPGCDHCYAAVSTPVRVKGIIWGQAQLRQRTSAANWQQLVKWNDAAGKGRFVQCDGCGMREFRKWDNTLPPGGLSCCSNPQCNALPESDSNPERPRVFCASLADWLDNEVPIEWLVDLLDLIRSTPNLDWLLLTKRIGNWRSHLEQAQNYIHENWPAVDAAPLSQWISAWLDDDAPAHVWLGITVINQAEADRDVPKLLQVPAHIHFLSIEPMLGSIHIPMTRNGPGPGALVEDEDGAPYPGTIDWVIVGGESGPHARPMYPDWVRSLRDQCVYARVPFLFKQWGEWCPGECADSLPTKTEEVAKFFNGKWDHYKLTVTESQILHADDAPDVYRLGKKAAGNLLDGRQHLEWPA